MATPDRKQEEERLLHRYVAAMEEIKLRVGIITDLLNVDIGFPDAIIQEFCYLQLRMVCELIAIGCLIAHGDIGTRKLRSEWNATNIIKGLEGLHPDFYPIPSTQKKDPDGIIAMMPNEEIKYLTKKQLLKLIGECGDQTHRGTEEKAFTGSRQQISFDTINHHCQMVFNLLGVHTILLRSRKTMISCGLETEGNRQVTALIAHVQ